MLFFFEVIKGVIGCGLDILDYLSKLCYIYLINIVINKMFYYYG